MFDKADFWSLTLQYQIRKNKNKTDMIQQRKTEAPAMLRTMQTPSQEQAPTSAPLDITKMITREKVAEYLKVSIQTVINYTNRGLLIAHKIGRRVLYNEDEVVAAIQSCAVKRYQHESTRLYIFNK